MPMTWQAVDDLVRRVAQKHGERAAAQLRADMREQWCARRTWWNEEMPRLRHVSATFAPASTSLGMRTICSSLTFDFVM